MIARARGILFVTYLIWVSVAGALDLSLLRSIYLPGRFINQVGPAEIYADAGSVGDVSATIRDALAGHAAVVQLRLVR